VSMSVKQVPAEIGHVMQLTSDRKKVPSFALCG